MTIGVYDHRVCALGEGPLWHPVRRQLFWFDILSKRLLSRTEDEIFNWDFDQAVSAAGWVDRDSLLVASEASLLRLNLVTNERQTIVPLEADNPLTRSNDGRADPWGGFWIGTMGKNFEQNAGAIYRYFRGELTSLFKDITIPNAICFSPDRAFAYFADTATQQIMQQPLSASNGWPVGAARVFIDLKSENLNPDGAVIDGEGCLWNAQWGASRIARYSPRGKLLEAIEFPAIQVSCPAFGGDNLKTLFATTAAIGTQGALQGQTFCAPGKAIGQMEHRVIL
jgi:sugar lactone lactonase YvrE